MSGHGYITPGELKARCGGPGVCRECKSELARALEHCAELFEREALPGLPFVAHLLNYTSAKERLTTIRFSWPNWHCARYLCSWLLLQASDIGADGLPLVRLGDPSVTAEVVGIGRTLEQAYFAAAFRALAHEATR
jgi:hypothetical protein